MKGALLKMETNLRQSETKITVEGILASKDLEIITDKNNNQGIRGNLAIKVDDLNTIRFKVYVGEKTSKGEKNKAWDGMMTVMNEYKSIADVGAENADKVRVGKGTFSTYRNQNGVDVVQYQSNFFNRVEGELNPARKFSVEGFVKSKVWETDSEGNETGRLKIKVIAPNFNGIDILDLIAPKESDGSANFSGIADDLFEVGNTYQIQGEIVNSRVVKKAVAALGSLEGETEYKNELIITGASPAYEEERAYNADAIQLAIQNYEDTQAQNQLRKEKVPFEQSKPSAAKVGRSGLSF